MAIILATGCGGNPKTPGSAQAASTRAAPGPSPTSFIANADEATDYVFRNSRSVKEYSDHSANASAMADGKDGDCYIVDIGESHSDHFVFSFQMKIDQNGRMWRGFEVPAQDAIQWRPE